MFQFELFGEWRNRTLYGTSLAAAVLAEKALQRPDNVGVRGAPTVEGERVTVAKVIGYRNVENSSRGAKRYISLLFEDSAGKVHDVDAVVTELDIKPAE